MKTFRTFKVSIEVKGIPEPALHGTVVKAGAKSSASITWSLQISVGSTTYRKIVIH